MERASQRLKREGAGWAQPLKTEELQKGGHEGAFDWIFLDLPCSGSGTLRRHPAQKWKLNEEKIAAFCQKQREIVAAAFPLLRSNGKMVYTTCSVLEEENEKQVQDIIKQYPLVPQRTPLKRVPHSGRGDGFFSSVLEKI